MTFTIPLTCALLAGALIETVGGVESDDPPGVSWVAMSVWISAALRARLYTRVSSMRPLNAYPEVPRRPMFTLLAEFCWDAVTVPTRLPLSSWPLR